MWEGTPAAVDFETRVIVFEEGASVQVMFVGAVARLRPGSSGVQAAAVLVEFFGHSRAGVLRRQGAQVGRQ